MTTAIPTAFAHTAFLVRNLEGTAQQLADSLRIGPWGIWTIVPTHCRVWGQERPFTFRVALATVGGGTFELVSPHTGDSVYNEHLERYGNSFHHTCLLYPSLEAVRDAKAALLRQGREVIQEAARDDVFEFAYFQFPELGSAVEVLYLDTSRMAKPEAVIHPSA